MGLGLQPTLAPQSPLDRGYRAPAASNHSLAQISAAQLLPSFCQSLYASNPGAMLGSGQAAGMALGSSHTHTSLSSGLDSSATNLGAARYLAGLGLNPGVCAMLLCLQLLLFVVCQKYTICCHFVYAKSTFWNQPTSNQYKRCSSAGDSTKQVLLSVLYRKL